jgi:HD superfamily phosphohydrolase
MSTVQPAVVELRDPLHGPIPVTAAELSVIDTPIFQRLRGVKQLGFAEFVFPGAVHHRYLHSIGALHVGGQMAARVLQPSPRLPETEARRLRQLVRLAALLHDVGHAPMSHAAERLLPRRSALLGLPPRDDDPVVGHEEVTLKLVADSPMTAVIDRAFADLGVTAAQVAAVVADEPGESHDAFVVKGVDYWPLVHGMVSGELDVDRMDYLLRDSYFAGVRYGTYDKDWLLSNATAVYDGDVARLGIHHRALPTFEHFLLARYHMFQMVYFHPKSDIYDAMLVRWLASLGEEARFPGDPDAYVACTDAWLMDRLRGSNDPWAQRIAGRRPLALVAELRTEAERARRTEVDIALHAAGIEPLWLTAKPILSRYAQSPASQRTNPLLVVDAKPPFGGPTRRRIEEVTDLFDRYDRSMRLERLYVIPEARTTAREIMTRMG